MKKILFFLAVLFFAGQSIFAQAPQGINYQGVARNSSGGAIGNTNVSVQITIMNGSTTFYQEHQTVTTDTFGLYSIVIGAPAAVVTQGIFTSIPWSGGNLMVQVDIDPAGGSAYNTVSTMNLESVPYALYAQTSGSSSNGTVTSLTGGTGIDASPSTITSTGSFSLAPSGVSPNTYGSSTSVPVITVDNMGRITAASTQTISAGNVVLAGAGLTSTAVNNTVTLNALNSSPIWSAGSIYTIPLNIGGLSNNDILQYNGTNWVNMPPPAALPTATSGQMLFNNGGTWTPTNTSNLTFTGSLLGIGTTSPTSPLDVQTTGTAPAIKATAGAGPAILSNGPLQLNGVLLDAGAATGSNGDLLMSQGTGVAPKWVSPSSLGGLPAPTQMGSLLFANTASTWAPTNASQVSTDGNSITVVNTTTSGTAGTFESNNAGAGNTAALLATSNNSNGYALRADNSTGAAILANSGGPYAIAGNISGGNGHGVAGWLRSNTVSGYGIYGLVDNTSSGSAGYFENQNPSNTQTVMQVINTPASAGRSAIFSGGTGVQIDKLQVQDTLNIPLNANVNWVLTSDAQGNALWAPPSAGVSSVTVSSPLVNTGTGTAPILGILPGDGSTPGYISVADWNTFNNKLATVSVNAPLIGNGTGGAPLQVGLNAGNIFVGNGSNLAAPVNMTGDVNITATGVTTVVGLQGRGILPGAPAANQVLQYNGSNWTNANISTLPPGTTGQMLYNNAGTWTTTASTSMFFTGSNLGIGTGAPGSPLEVNSAGAGIPSIKSVNSGGGAAGAFINAGSAPAGTFSITAAGNSVAALVTGTGGTGPAATFSITNATSSAQAVNISNAGGGPGIVANTVGDGVNITTSGSTGVAANLTNNNTGNNANVMNVTTTGNGFTGAFSGGKGLQTDKFEMTGNGPGPNAVMISSNAAGDAAWSAPVNFSAQGGSTSATSGTASAILFGTTNYANPAACFNGTSFTAQTNGLHHFDCGVAMNIATGLASAQDYVVRLVVGGSTYREASIHLPTGYAGVVQNVLSADAQLTSGQTVQVQVFQTTGQSLTVVGGPPAVQTFFNGHLVH